MKAAATALGVSAATVLVAIAAWAPVSRGADDTAPAEERAGAESRPAPLDTGDAAAAPEPPRPKRRRFGGFDWGRPDPFENPPLARSSEERKVLAFLEEREKGPWAQSVTTREGRLLRLLTEAVGAKRVVEIGTSTG